MGGNELTPTPLHPGEVLLEEYLKPMRIRQNSLALNMRVPAQRNNETINGKRAITAFGVMTY